MSGAVSRLPSVAKLMLVYQLRTFSSSPSSRRFFSFFSSVSIPSSSLSYFRRSFATIMNDGHDKYDPYVEEIFAKKRSLRSQIRKQLKNMSPAQRAEEDITIQNVVSEAPWFKSASGLCAYVNCDALREVDTSKLLASILLDETKDNCSKNRKKLYLPRIEDRNSNMRMIRVSSYDDLVPNSMNILEPSMQDRHGNEREDRLAFDKSGRRLGRSGGYYDVYLKKYFEVVRRRKWKSPLIVALSYSIQIVEDGAIGITPDDIPVDALVCPSGAIYTNVIGKNL